MMLCWRIMMLLVFLAMMRCLPKNIRRSRHHFRRKHHWQSQHHLPQANIIQIPPSAKKEKPPLWVVQIIGREGGICLHFRYAKIKVSPPSSRRRAQSPGLLHLNFSNPSFCKKRTHPIKGCVFFWRRRRDLNPRYPFGVYTISNRARSASYATSP